MKLFFYPLMVAVVFCQLSLAETQDNDTILQIAQGDKLVLKKDLIIPPNTHRLDFGSISFSGSLLRGCSLILNSSPKRRKLLAGEELVFSGTTWEEVKVNKYHHTEFKYHAYFDNSETMFSLDCYGSSLTDSYMDLHISGMKDQLKGYFDFVPVEPVISH